MPVREHVVVYQDPGALGPPRIRDSESVPQLGLRQVSSLSVRLLGKRVGWPGLDDRRDVIEVKGPRGTGRHVLRGPLQDQSCVVEIPPISSDIGRASDDEVEVPECLSLLLKKSGE